jgi:hypothetical protein
VAHANGAPSDPGVGWFMESLLGAAASSATPTDLVRVVDGLDPACRASTSSTRSPYLQMLTKPGPGGWGWACASSAARPSGTPARCQLPRDGGAPGRRRHWAITTERQLRRPRQRPVLVMSRAIATIGAWPTWDLGPDLP